MAYRETLDFLLHRWLRVESLCERERFAEHSRETFDSVLDTCERIAREKFVPASRASDVEEPWFDGEKVHLPATSHAAATAYFESGMLAAAQDAEWGGMQLPCVVEMAANAFFAKAGIGVGGGGMLTSGNANLLMAHGTPAQKEAFARHEFSGRFSGTMCLSEPQAGSSLSDIATRAVPDGPDFESDPLGPRYRLTGHKMWISNGEHELTENIVHLVLAKIPGPDGRLVAGTRGISLFVVPKKLVDESGALTGERNDVSLAGLNHKLGYRGIPNTLLNFGEGRYPVRGGAGDGPDGARPGAIGYRVGAAGEGLRCMFHMMNEARIGVGLGATMLGMAGYEASLDYAKQRAQGRPIGPGGKDPARPPVRIVEHADVKRMLLAQKAICEGALALELWCARQVDELHTAPDDSGKARAHLLLEMLTPIAKSFPSEWCLEANSLAIQVHGGYGYTRDFPVEQLWRDNRLNMIHEGTHGIQGLDLLGRKAVMEGGKGLALVREAMRETAARARGAGPHPGPLPQAGEGDSTPSPARAGEGRGEGATFADALESAADRLVAATRSAWSTNDPTAALANATLYLTAFGHVVVAWMWLDVLLAVEGDDPASQGRRAAARYWFRYELPKIDAWLAVVATRDDTCSALDEAAF